MQGLNQNLPSETLRKSKKHVGEKTTSNTFRNPRPVSDSSPATQKKALASTYREDIILYQDEQLIRSIFTQLIAASDHKPSSIAKMLEEIQTFLCKFGISLEDFDKDNVTEFAIKPVLKSAAAVEVGAEFEIKWDLDNKINNTSKAVLILFYKLSVKSVSELVCHAKRQGPNTPKADLIYVGKPICVYGVLGSDNPSDGPCLIDGSHAVDIILNHDREKLRSQLPFLQNRRLFVIGLIESVYPLKVSSGAILLSNRALYSIESVVK